MTKNSLKTEPDELGYYGEGTSAMGVWQLEKL